MAPNGLDLPTEIAGVVDRLLQALESDRLGKHRLRREPHQERGGEKEEKFLATYISLWLLL